MTRPLHYIADYSPAAPVRGVSPFAEWADDLNGRGFKVEVLDGKIRLDADTVHVLDQDSDPIDFGGISGEHPGNREIWFDGIGYPLIPEAGTGDLYEQMLGLHARVREQYGEDSDEWTATGAAIAYAVETPKAPGADLYESLETMRDSFGTLLAMQAKLEKDKGRR